MGGERFYFFWSAGATIILHMIVLIDNYDSFTYNLGAEAG